MNYIDTIGDMERLNSGLGHHFFDDDTMRFFSSKIHEPVIRHRFFVTSERMGFDDHRRESRLRMIRDTGAIETVGDDDQRFPAPAKARKALGKVIDDITVRFDPYEDDVPRLAGLPEAELMRRFAWRAYVGGYPIGSRTTRTDARKIASEAKKPCEL